MSGADEMRQRGLPTVEQVEAERRRLKRNKAFWKALRTTLFVLIVVAALAVLVSSLVLPVLQISGESMDPTLKNGDIIVLVKSDTLETGDLCSFTWNNKTLVKRVIAGSGDWVDIDEQGRVYVNGEPIDEPYVLDGLSLGQCDISFPYQVAEDSYFVMGDRRAESIDSRSSVIGSVHKDQLVGKVWLRVYPFDRMGAVS